MSSSAASTLLNVARSHSAGDVMEFTAAKRAKQLEKARSFSETEGAKSETVIVVDSKLTPLEAATLLWENNM